MDKKRIRELKGKAQALDATVQVGKEGVTSKLANEVSKQLKSKRLVKVKFLPSMEQDKREAAAVLAEATSSTLVEIRGRTAVFAIE
jgi:RNA-binding protein